MIIHTRCVCQVLAEGSYNTTHPVFAGIGCACNTLFHRSAGLLETILSGRSAHRSAAVLDNARLKPGLEQHRASWRLMSYERELEFARRAAALAGENAIRIRQGDIGVET